MVKFSIFSHSTSLHAKQIHLRICPYCRRPRRASKRLSLARLPQFLVIHLKRFSSLSEKIPTPVEFPLTSMDLGHLLPPNIPGVVLNQSLEAVTEYELYGVVSHHSDGKTRGGDSLTSGHCQLSLSLLRTIY